MHPPYRKMARSGSGSQPQAGRSSLRLVASYAVDWIVLVAVVVAGGFLGRVEPNKRPFSLDDANISFPYTVDQTVPAWLLVVLCALVPAAVILVVAIVLVPGSTVPRDTPPLLVWKRKLWELHVGWLGLLMAVGSAFFFVSGIKNMCGKPRPDMLARCDPDLANAARFRVGGVGGGDNARAVLYSADICRQSDRYRLDDGFRSYPSGHAASAAAGLVYLSLFLASKLAVTVPFVAAASWLHEAFPSRAADAPGRALRHHEADHEADHDADHDADAAADPDPDAFPLSKPPPAARHNARLQSLRRQAAAPPVYLLVVTLAPFCVAVFIAASRWFDFRHHGFDILFGFLIGLLTAFYSFRFYHLPVMAGAGWAWGPRSHDRAFWAGVGRLGFAGRRSDRPDLDLRAGVAEPPPDIVLDTLAPDRRLPQHRQQLHQPAPSSSRLSHRSPHNRFDAGPPQPGPYDDFHLDSTQYPRHPPPGPLTGLPPMR